MNNIKFSLTEKNRNESIQMHVVRILKYVLEGTLK